MNQVNTQTEATPTPPSTGEKILVRLGIRDPRPGLGYEAYEDLGLTKRQKVTLAAAGLAVATASFIGINRNFDNDPSLQVPSDPTGQMSPDGGTPVQPGELQVDHLPVQD